MTEGAWRGGITCTAKFVEGGLRGAPPPPVQLELNCVNCVDEIRGVLTDNGWTT